MFPGQYPAKKRKGHVIVAMGRSADVPRFWRKNESSAKKVENTLPGRMKFSHSSGIRSGDETTQIMKTIPVG